MPARRESAAARKSELGLSFWVKGRAVGAISSARQSAFFESGMSAILQEKRLERTCALEFHRRVRPPLAAEQQFQRPEVGFVIHLVRAGDPIAQIDVWETRRARLLDVIEDRIDAWASFWLAWIEERIDERKPIAQHIDKR